MIGEQPRLSHAHRDDWYERKPGSDLTSCIGDFVKSPLRNLAFCVAVYEQQVWQSFSSTDRLESARHRETGRVRQAFELGCRDIDPYATLKAHCFEMRSQRTI